MDRNVSDVIRKYAVRAEKGYQKYGTDTTRMDLNTYEWLNHLQEELMDATVYIQRLKSDLQTEIHWKHPGQLELPLTTEAVTISEFVNGNRFAMVNQVEGGYEVVCSEDGEEVSKHYTVERHLAKVEALAEDFVLGEV